MNAATATALMIFVPTTIYTAKNVASFVNSVTNAFTKTGLNFAKTAVFAYTAVWTMRMQKVVNAVNIVSKTLTGTNISVLIAAMLSVP